MAVGAAQRAVAEGRDAGAAEAVPAHRRDRLSQHQPNWFGAAVTAMPDNLGSFCRMSTAELMGSDCNESIPKDDTRLVVQAAAQHAVERVQFRGVVAAEAQRALHGLGLRIRLRLLRLRPRLLWRLLLLLFRLGHWQSAVVIAPSGRRHMCGAASRRGSTALRMRRACRGTLRRLVCVSPVVLHRAARGLRLSVPPGDHQIVLYQCATGRQRRKMTQRAKYTLITAGVCVVYTVARPVVETMALSHAMKVQIVT